MQKILSKFVYIYNFMQYFFILNLFFHFFVLWIDQGSLIFFAPSTFVADKVSSLCTSKVTDIFLTSQIDYWIPQLLWKKKSQAGIRFSVWFPVFVLMRIKSKKSIQVNLYWHTHSSIKCFGWSRSGFLSGLQFFFLMVI